MRSSALLLTLVVAAGCVSPPPRPACVRFDRQLETLASSGGPDADVQAHVLADGLRCLQADVPAFRRVALSTLDDTRAFELAGDYAGGRACAAEICLVIAAMRDLGADGYDLADVDGELSPEERERLLRTLQLE